MLYLDTFGAAGGVGRCSVELLPLLGRELGAVTLAGRSHVIDSYRDALSEITEVRRRNLELPRFEPGALALRALARLAPESATLTHRLLERAGLRGDESRPVLINYPQVLAPPRRDYTFDIFLHDLNWCRYPENFDDANGLDRRCREWVRRARRVFTNSDFTREEVIGLYGTDSRRVISAPLAPPSHLPPASRDDSTKLEKFGLTAGGYFFYPSVHGAHKGHDVLAEALTDGISILPVVITAPLENAVQEKSGSDSNRGLAAEVQRKLGNLRREGKIISLPGLAWTDVLLIARSCRAYVLPSRFEGFGFPLVEAMALGKFSICSDIPPFREILQRYGSLIRATTFPSGDAAALRNLLVAESRTDGRATNMRGGPPDLSSAWRWADTAKVIADAIR